MSEDEFKEPDWYDRGRLCKAYLGEDETGWVIDLGDGTCRLANQPLPRGDVDLGWGDLVPLHKSSAFPKIERKILEKYDPEVDRIKPEEEE